MPVECKSVTCCDLDDFPQTSSEDGNCPVGYHWNGQYCKIGECIPMRSENGTIMLSENGRPMCSE